MHELMKFNVNWPSNYFLSQDSVHVCVCVYSQEVDFGCLHASCGGSYVAGQLKIHREAKRCGP